MKKVQFKNEILQKGFAEKGLISFDDFFDYTDGQEINRNTKRNVLVLRVEMDGRSQTFYMKRFERPHFKDMLFALRNTGRLCTQGRLEWIYAHRLPEKGIGTYEPVVYGEHTRWGLERGSFLMTRQLCGICLADFLATQWQDLSRPEQKILIRQLAEFFKKIHCGRTSLPDSYSWHIFLSPQEEGGYSFSIIDLHRMLVKVRGRKQAARDLGAFLYSLPEDRVDKELHDLFLSAYLHPQGVSENRAFIGEVEKRRHVLLARRGRPHL